MLGKIFENLLEDNKDKGAFYTPKEIVRYMCQESLIAYLETNTSIAKDKIRQFVLSPEEGVADIPENKKPKLLAALKEVKICDPAIGSGAFPMGLLNELLKCREALNQFPSPSPVPIPAPVPVPSTPSPIPRSLLKKDIIQNNIYGVDIEKGAVDIARLRFWLSIVVDEEKASPLPNLDYKIMQGNSLIESFMGVDLSKLTYEKEYKKDKGEFSLFDDEKNRLQKTVSHLLSSYYSCSDHDRKVKLQQDISDTINKQLEAQAYNPETLRELRTINLAENNKFFLWHTWFSDVFNRDDKDGFDIVIGNPPYVVVADIDKERLYYKYKTKNCLELYSYFFEHSINILHHNGVLSFITGSLYTKGIKFEPLRSFLENNSQLITYRNEGDEVFKNVNMPTSTILLYKSNECKWNFDNLLLGKSNGILKKMDKVSKQLSDISIIQRGFEVGKNRVSNVNGKYRFLTGSNAEKYCYKTVSYIDQDVVDEFQKDIKFYRGERLLIRETGSYLTIVYLNENIFCNRSLYSTIIKDETFDTKYVVGILNSRAIQYYYQQKFKADTELFPKIRIKQAKQLPIPIVPTEVQLKISQFVTEIISAKRNNLSSTNIEKNIDEIVYRLYGLSDEEIKVVEENCQ